jgi:hypothetical protein
MPTLYWTIASTIANTSNIYRSCSRHKTRSNIVLRANLILLGHPYLEAVTNRIDQCETCIYSCFFPGGCWTGWLKVVIIECCVEKASWRWGSRALVSQGIGVKCMEDQEVQRVWHSQKGELKGWPCKSFENCTQARNFAKRPWLNY